MRRPVRYFPYISLALLLLLPFSLSQRATDQVRSFFVSALKTPPSLLSATPSLKEELLQQENLKLKKELALLHERLFAEETLDRRLALVQRLSSKQAESPYWARRKLEVLELAQMQLSSLTGRVIFREPTSWSSSLWLNVGEADNRLLGKEIVAKNSPVCSGEALIGLVELVEEKKCRVRLITDSQLTPSVRVIRGESQDALLLQRLESLLELLFLRPTTLSKEGFDSLVRLKNSLHKELGDQYLAKGSLHGSSQPLFRARGDRLKGVGFNYDFADLEGGPHDIRTKTLLSIGDLLVTTGFDGVFPPGLPVAHVVHISPLQEGACFYELEAEAVAGDLEKIETVFVLPPL